MALTEASACACGALAQCSCPLHLLSKHTAVFHTAAAVDPNSNPYGTRVCTLYAKVCSDDGVQPCSAIVGSTTQTILVSWGQHTGPC